MRKTTLLLALLLCSSLAFAATCGTGTTSTMVGYWKLDQSTGAVVDSFNGYNGTNVGAARGLSGVVNNAFDFDGNYNIVKVPTFPDYTTQPVTVCAWFNAAGEITENERLVSKGTTGSSYGFQLTFYNGNDGISFGDSAGFRYTNAAFDDQNWHFACGVFDGTPNFSGLKIYVDGVDQPSGTAGSFNGFSATSEDLTFGSYTISGTVYPAYSFDGMMDEIAIFNSSLSESAIEELYNLSDAGSGYCELAGQEVVPEVSNTSLKIALLLVIVVIIGAILVKRD